jgi:hypothetical protein
VANHKGGQEKSCRRMVDGILELVKRSSEMLAMVVRFEDGTSQNKTIKDQTKESTTSTGGCAD